MSGIIVYRSSYGSTKQYADWIHEETGFPMFDSRDKAIPWDADTVVIGCPVLANKPFLVSWMQKNWDKMSGKRIVLFTTSGADPASEPVKDWIDKALPESMKGKVKVFPLAGRFNFAELNGMHKLMMRIGAVVLRSEEIKNQIKHPVDGVARKSLAELLAFVKS
ncbi:flavodoxin domain-containing protein [Candidatus Bipolaricaulota bacterium]|nr:flavodoxin domain-containing protein [Candidatus Bipolaricaulota bacterium]